MTSTISCNSKTHQFLSMYLWSMRKNMATIITYSLFLLFSYPLLLLFYNTLTAANIMDRTDFLLEANATVYPIIFGGILMLFTLLVSVFMFSYLHKKRSVDMFGALPMSRRTLFFSRYLAGLTILLVPLLVITGVCIPMCLPHTGAVWALLNAMLCLVLSTIVSYTFTAFIAVCCGTTADTVISVLAINGLYPAAVGICQLMSTTILPGVITEFNPSVVAYTAFSPYVTGITSAITSTARYDNTNIFEMPGQLLWWFILAAACFAGCVVLSRRRKAESAQAGFAFRLPAVIVRFIACVTIGLLFGLIFGSISTGVRDVNVMQHHLWFIVGLVIGSFITHMVVTFIYNRGIKGFLKSLIPYGVLLAVVLAGYTIVVTGLFGCDVYVPKTDEVKSVRFVVNASVTDSVSNNDMVVDTAQFEDKEQIEEVVAVHSEITGGLRDKIGYPYTLYSGSISHGEGDEGQYNLKKISMEYTLQNGSTVLREYKEGQYDLGEISGKVQKLTSSVEYKKQTNVLFVMENTYPAYMTAHSDGFYYDGEAAVTPGEKGVTITDRGQLMELAAALRQDILEDGSYGIYSYNAYTAKGKGVVQLAIGYQVEDDNCLKMFNVPETYERSWEVLGRFMMRPVGADELKKDSYAQELFRVPDPKETDTYKNTLSAGDIEVIKNKDQSTAAVTFQPPEGWDQDNIYCSMIADTGEGLMPFDTKFGELSRCEKKNGVFSYSLPSMVMWSTVQFYDADGNATQKFDISGISDNAAVVPDGQFKTESGKTYTMFTLR